MLDKILFKLLFGRNTGGYILNEEWDNLIILDACRYDAFEKIFKEDGLPGKLEYRISRGSDTTEFLIENFTLDSYEDIVYVTANPFVSRILKNKLYKIVPVWYFGWNEKYGTVLPETVYFYALKAIRKYPDKRIIIHFVQPHYPYVGDISNDPLMREVFRKLREDTLSEQLDGTTKEYKIPVNIKLTRILEIIKERKLYPKGYDFYVKVDPAIQWRAYINNLKLVIPYVKKLLEVLPGKTVVTADHGEAFGEYLHPLIPVRVYGHFPKLRIPSLVKVPWLIVNETEKPPREKRERILNGEILRYEQLKIRQIATKLKG